MFGKIKNLFYFGFILVFLISCSEEKCIEKNDFGAYDTVKFSEKLEEEIHKIEHRIYPETLKNLCKNKYFCNNYE